MKLSTLFLSVITWFTALVLTVPPAALADDTEGPKRGTLLIAGGGGKHAAAIFRKFVDLAGGDDAKIVIVPTAISSDPKYDYQNMGTVRFARDTLKLKHVTVLHTHDRLKADTREFVQPLKTADGVWFSGGRQWRFADSYLGTRSEKEFHRVLKRGGVIGGSSAGASIQADFLVRGDSKTNTIMIGDHQRGLGFLENCAIDQHVVKRGRQMGLVQVLTDPKGKMLKRFDREDLLGIGIDEDTAIIVRKNTFEVFGKPDAAVLIYDPRGWTSETPDAQKFISLKLGARYNMKKRRVLAPTR
ncbi:MAG: cyanophycinase [Planctomycetota bacterium]|nr:cyanophycinase [Planctomycetota bacterium]